MAEEQLAAWAWSEEELAALERLIAWAWSNEQAAAWALPEEQLAAWGWTSEQLAAAFNLGPAGEESEAGNA